MVQKFSQWIEQILVWQVRRLIKAHRPKIVAVTGSVGKTSTKSAIAHVLSGKYRVLAHKGNYNSAIGLPLAIFKHSTPGWLANPFAWISIIFRNEGAIRSVPEYDVWVLEMGAERKGEIAKFLEYIHPDIGVVTAIKGVHMDEGQFGSLDEILSEKWQLAAKSKTSLANCEDAVLKKQKSDLTYGVDSGDYHFANLAFDETGFKGKLKVRAKDTVVSGGIIARHSLYALAAAAGVGDQFEMTPGEIAAQIASFEPAHGRMNILAGKHGTLIIDDSYNSHPDTAAAALETLYSLTAKGRKIGIIGSMNELGQSSEAGHEYVGENCAKLDLLVTVGDKARDLIVPAAQKAGLSHTKIRSFDNPYRAGEFVLANLRSGDIVLAKGSQNGVFTEEAVKQLLANKEDASKLVRQSPEWLERKKRSFGVK